MWRGDWRNALTIEHVLTLRDHYRVIGHFWVPPGPLFQNEGRWTAFDMEIIFHFHANKIHFHKKGCAPNLILKVRVLQLGSGLLAQHNTNQFHIDCQKNQAGNCSWMHWFCWCKFRCSNRDCSHTRLYLKQTIITAKYCKQTNKKRNKNPFLWRVL